MSFDAPWGTSLRWMTAVTVAVLLALAAFGAATSGGDAYRLLALTVLPLAILLGAIPFSILGYRITGDFLLIRRPLWTTRVDLCGLREVRADPKAMSGSLRLFGNGGLFSFTGRFRNSSLGSYRAWVTDPARAVVLELPGRTVVVSPDRPAEMAGILRERIAS